MGSGEGERVREGERDIERVRATACDGEGGRKKRKKGKKEANRRDELGGPRSGSLADSASWSRPPRRRYRSRRDVVAYHRDAIDKACGRNNGNETVFALGPCPSRDNNY